MNVKQLQEKRRQALLAARGIVDEAQKAQRELTADEMGKIDAALTEAKKLEQQIKEAEERDRLVKQVMDLAEGAEPAPQAGSGQPGGGRGRKTLGQRFVESDEFHAWMKQVAPGGQIPANARGLTSPSLHFKGLGELFGRKKLIVGADDESAGAFVRTDYTGIYESLGREPLTLRQLISIRQTTSDLVEFVRQTAQVTQATVVAEANVTEYSGATGEVSGEKPEGTSTWEKVQEPVKTIAVWIPATKRALSDVSQLRGLIDQELREDVAAELENQILNGTGVGENFTGLVNTTGVLTQAWDTDILTTTRKALTTLQVSGLSTPTAWLLNPIDWETVDLQQADNGLFYFGGPMREGTRVLWGPPVIPSSYVTQGQGILGDWRKAVLWDRETATITASDSHADFFIRNMVAILCELRAAFGLIRPSAFVLTDLESGS
jgi:HK97 family phage major capsid protein